MLRSLLIALALFAATPAFADQPKFSDYPADIYKGKVAKPILDTADKREFKTRINEAAKGKVDFAGHFIVAEWGCGASCLGGAVIDAKTGVVTMIPWSTCCTMWNGDADRIQRKADSRLIAFVGMINEEEPDAFHWFEFDRGNFKPVATEPVK
jgi:hypothetical protein